MENFSEGLLFVSDTTKAIYFWNGKEVIRVFSGNSKSRPVGAIVKGLPLKKIQFAHIFCADGFYVDEAHYSVLKSITIDDINSAINTPKKGHR